MQPALVTRLAGIVGSAHCLIGADRSPFVVEGRTPGAVVVPGTAEEAGQVVALAAEAGVPLLPWGGGTAITLGAPPAADALVVATRRLGRLVEHEPGDLTATVEAGITLDALQTALAGRGQWLPLDPPGGARATLGGILATNASGPRRHLYGTARDHVIGLRVIGADGALVRAGGKVVKNVAGYDLVKLHLGALGTLGLIIEATLKLRPRPEADRACRAAFSDLAGAARGAAALMASDLVPHSLELVDPGAAALSGVGGADGAALVAGFDGLPATVTWQLEEAARLLRAAGARAVQALDDAAAAAALGAVRDVRDAAPAALAVARVGLPPAAVASYVAAARAAVEPLGLRLLATAHAGEGVLTLVLLPAGGAAGAATPTKALGLLRDHAHGHGGHLTIERAPLAVKDELPVWDPPGPALGLMRGIKSRLDPKGILNPGRFVGGL